MKISKKLRIELDNLIQETQKRLPDHVIHSSLSTPTPSQTAGELHVSLTHPLPLRISQVDDFRTELSRSISQWSTRNSVTSIRTSLAGWTSVYFNGRATGGEGTGGRAFMALRLGAGSSEVRPSSPSIRHLGLHKLIYRWGRSSTRLFIPCLTNITFRFTTRIQSITLPSLGAYSIPPAPERLHRQMVTPKLISTIEGICFLVDCRHSRQTWSESWIESSSKRSSPRTQKVGGTYRTLPSG